MPRRTESHHSRLDPDPVVTGKALLLACLLHVAAVLLLFPPEVRDRNFAEDAVRFGYAGPERYVREIRVRLTSQSVGAATANRLLGNVRKIADAPRGEAGKPVPPGGKRGGGQGGLSRVAGQARESLLGSLRGGLLDLPTVQSEELVIVTLVRPDYPQVAIEQGIEGHVELLALVNVHGAVDDVRIVRSAGRLLDGAASNAVRRCRFQPFRLGGRIQPVYASFRFNFTLVER